jgi:hypothetical protein
MAASAGSGCLCVQPKVRHEKRLIALHQGLCKAVRLLQDPLQGDTGIDDQRQGQLSMVPGKSPAPPIRDSRRSSAALADPRPDVRRRNSAKRAAAAARGDDCAASANAKRKISRCSASAERPCSAARMRSARTTSSPRLRTVRVATRIPRCACWQCSHIAGITCAGNPLVPIRGGASWAAVVTAPNNCYM